MLYIYFVLFLKGQILREFQYIASEKCMILKKECMALFSILASIETRRKSLDLTKNCVSFSILKNWRFARYI